MIKTLLFLFLSAASCGAWTVEVWNNSTNNGMYVNLPLGNTVLHNSPLVQLELNMQYNVLIPTNSDYALFIPANYPSSSATYYFLPGSTYVSTYWFERGFVVGCPLAGSWFLGWAVYQGLRARRGFSFRGES